MTMHTYERIALWVIVVFLIFKVFFIGTSGYTASNPLSIMDLAEFNGVPGPVKQIWQTNITNTIMPAITSKFTQFWNNLSADKQTNISNVYGSASTQLATNIGKMNVYAK